MWWVLKRCENEGFEGFRRSKFRIFLRLSPSICQPFFWISAIMPDVRKFNFGQNLTQNVQREKLQRCYFSSENFYIKWNLIHAIGCGWYYSVLFNFDIRCVSVGAHRSFCVNFAKVNEISEVLNIKVKWPGHAELLFL